MELGGGLNELDGGEWNWVVVGARFSNSHIKGYLLGISFLLVYEAF